MQTARIIIFSIVLSFLLCGASAISAEKEEFDSEGISLLPDKYEVIIVDGKKAQELSEKCKCRFIVNEEKHFVIFLNLAEGICI